MEYTYNVQESYHRLRLVAVTSGQCWREAFGRQVRPEGNPGTESRHIGSKGKLLLAAPFDHLHFYLQFTI